MRASYKPVKVMMLSKLRVTHVITGLKPFGAEVMLSRLIEKSDSQNFSHHVISLTGDDVIGDVIRDLGVEVQLLGLRASFPNPGLLLRLSNWIKKAQPDLVQTWLYHGDLIGGLVTRLNHTAPVVWGVHHSNLDPKVDRWSTVMTARACARVSHWVPDRIICCSRASYRVHADLGYPKDHMVIIPNGFDLDQFFPSHQARSDFRQDLGLGEDTFLIGMAGRYHPQKDHITFVRAAKILSERVKGIRFLLSGSGLDEGNQALMEIIRGQGITDTIHLLGHRADMHGFYAALDLFTLTSQGEAFPNVVGEAMACGVPCVVTDVGDCSEMVGDTGLVVPPRNPQALASGWEKLYLQTPGERSALGMRARNRVQKNFELKHITSQYEKLYQQVVSDYLNQEYT